MENMTVTAPDTSAAAQLDTLGLLPGEKRETSEIIQSLVELISSAGHTSAESVAEGEYLFPPLDEVSQMALVSHSLAAYLHHLRRGQLIRLTSRISTDTTRWLSHVFRFVDGVATYHHDSAETIVKALRLAIISRGTDATPASPSTLSQTGCVYVCEESAMLGLQFACRQLGMNADCVRLVPQNATTSGSGGSVGTMDVSVLQKLILEDVGSGRQPLLVIATAGTPIMGSVDNVARIYDVCRAQNVWLHLRGHCLAALATSIGPGDVSLRGC